MTIKIISKESLTNKRKRDIFQGNANVITFEYGETGYLNPKFEQKPNISEIIIIVPKDLFQQVVQSVIEVSISKAVLNKSRNIFASFIDSVKSVTTSPMATTVITSIATLATELHNFNTLPSQSEHQFNQSFPTESVIRILTAFATASLIHMGGKELHRISDVIKAKEDEMITIPEEKVKQVFDALNEVMNEYRIKIKGLSGNEEVNSKSIDLEKELYKTVYSSPQLEIQKKSDIAVTRL